MKAFILSRIITRKDESATMKTIVFANQKGGPGKTTLAAHLAVAAERSGDGPCVLIDTDPQASLTDWWNERKDHAPGFAPVTIQDLSAKIEALDMTGFAYAFVDTPAGVTGAIRVAVALADFVLIPTRPSPHDMRAVGHTIDLVNDANRPFAFAITQAKPFSRLAVLVRAALSDHGVVAPPIVHDRVDYAASMIDGRTVLETEPGGKSAAEIVELWFFVKKRMHESTT
jgi:chromosome partitioning protein